MVALTFLLLNERHMSPKVAGPDAVEKVFVNGLAMNEAERVDELPVVPTLRNLKIFNSRYNNVSTLHWFRDHPTLKELILSHNQVEEESEFAHLSTCANLRAVWLDSNPVYRRLGAKACKLALLRAVPQLQTFGHEDITEEDRKEAAELAKAAIRNMVPTPTKNPVANGANLIKPLHIENGGARVYPWAARGTAASELDRAAAAAQAARPPSPADRPAPGRLSPAPTADRMSPAVAPGSPAAQNGAAWRPVTPQLDANLGEAERQRLQTPANQSYLASAVLFILQAMKDEELISIRTICERRLADRTAARAAQVASPGPLLR